METLEQLLGAMITNDPSVLNRYGEWSSSLPTYGGAEPENTLEVWSWDADRLLVGACADDLRIVSREDW